MKEQTKKKVIRRLKIIEGQIRGLESLVKKDQYCIDIITQTQAVKQALSSIEDFMLENHLSTHVIEQMTSNKKDKAIKEILSVYKLSKRK